MEERQVVDGGDQASPVPGGSDVLDMKDVDGVAVGRRRQKKGDPQEGVLDS